MKRNMTSKAQEAVMAYPLLRAHFRSSFLQTDRTSGLFIMIVVDVRCLGDDEGEVGGELRRHEKPFCEGEVGAVEGE